MLLERGSSLIEALLAIGLFLLFIWMVNQSIANYGSVLQRVEEMSQQREVSENRREGG